MKIGIDIRALQTGHKFRGIGEVAKQVTNRVLKFAEHDNYEIIFYEYDDDDPKKLLDLPKNLKFSVEKVGKNPEITKNKTRKSKIINAYKNTFGKPIKNSGKSDVFLQFDYAFGVPKNTKTILIKHDLIPLVFWNDFFQSPRFSLRYHAFRSMIKTMLINYRFRRILRRGVKNAHKIISVSDSTKNDLMKYLKVPAKKIKTVHLGVSTKEAKSDETNDKKTLPTKPYLLFIGAGDQRRRVDDLVAAYNNLKAEGNDIQLVLAGENFKSPKEIPNETVRREILNSSYADDILTLGYIDDKTKQKLFQGAIAFVYPTLYEGFGIPVLESFLWNCPVVTYKNSSIPEVGGKYAIYVNDWQGIKNSIEDLLNQSKKDREKSVFSAKKYAEKFTWEKTAKNIYDELVD